MPVFDTPQPISATIELSAGDVRIVASDRTDTRVEVQPTDEADQSDVDAAEQTRVGCTDGTLRVKGPKTHALDFSRKTRSVDVTIELPTGSQIHGEAASADFRCTGRLGQCGIKTAVGHIVLDRTGPAHVKTSTGDVTAGQISGDALVITGSGRVVVGEFDGAATVKNSNGETRIGTATGDLTVRAANGDIAVEHAGGGVEARSANGSVRVSEVAGPSVVLETRLGALEVGVPEGTAAWVEAKTGRGRLHNELADAAQGPEPGERTVEVRARTSFGDITIRRA